ncbi:nuclear receptor-binding protein-like [Acropora muricata]|uniref:nuclear receptor-binding protein-like n=1 Tax=Acropora millepora TaxID=45264 RepID=UPI001CF133C5|nr:nuclear receptor-binding protein-like [Acropora millepora]
MASNIPLGVKEVPQEHSGDESDDDVDDVVELSPCGRWEKRRQEVMQRDVPGIDHSFLAMDTEEGVEVVWNEVQFSERKYFKSQEATVNAVFENLIQLDHANIVKFYKFWTDPRSETPRVIFITEYMTSGSLKQFLKKTRKSNYKTLNEKVWKKWLRQILSALSYLHGCETPIVHGNLSCDTIFIQHNGLIKIGSVAPDTIHNHVKTYRDERRNMHFIAPEYGKPGHVINCAVDIYAFGMCALEMAALELHDTEGRVLKENIQRAIEGLEQPVQKDFIRRCLAENPADRPTANELMLHPSLFVVHSLKLLAAHCMVDNDVCPPDNREDTTPETVLAVLKLSDGNEKTWARGKSPALELEKYLEEVRNGLFPLTGMQKRKESRPRQRPTSPEGVESEQSENDDRYDEETRLAAVNRCHIKLKAQDSDEKKQQYQLELVLKLSDKMNRHLVCDLRPGDKGGDMADDLIRCGLINKVDREMIAAAMQDQLNQYPAMKT